MPKKMESIGASTTVFGLQIPFPGAPARFPPVGGGIAFAELQDVPPPWAVAVYEASVVDGLVNSLKLQINNLAKDVADLKQMSKPSLRRRKSK